MNITVNVLPLDKPSNNGRIYDRLALEKAIKEFNDKCPVLGAETSLYGIDTDRPLPLTEVSHVVEKVEIIENNVTAAIKILSTQKGIALRDMLDKGFPVEFTPVGVGKIQVEGSPEQIIITDYTLIGISFWLNNLTKDR